MSDKSKESGSGCCLDKIVLTATWFGLGAVNGYYDSKGWQFDSKFLDFATSYGPIAVVGGYKGITWACEGVPLGFALLAAGQGLVEHDKIKHSEVVKVEGDREIPLDETQAVKNVILTGAAGGAVAGIVSFLSGLVYGSAVAGIPTGAGYLSGQAYGHLENWLNS